MAKRAPSRPARWQEATATARAAYDKAVEAAAEAADALSDLRDIQQEYQDWRDNLPENFAGSALSEKLDAVSDMDLEPGDDLDAIGTAIDEAESADLPRGFGKD